jgi:hypothetical protein
VKPEHVSVTDDPARFRTTRWSAILFGPAAINEEIHALCDALIVPEGWL